MNWRDMRKAKKTQNRFSSLSAVNYNQNSCKILLNLIRLEFVTDTIGEPTKEDISRTISYTYNILSLFLLIFRFLYE